MNEKKVKIITTSEWILTKLIVLIPIVNIIMLFIWAYNKKTDLNKSNWAKAELVVLTVKFILYLIIIFITIILFLNFFNEFLESTFRV